MKEDAAAEQAGELNDATVRSGSPSDSITDVQALTLDSAGRRKSTRHLIERAIARLVRAGGRHSEADADHLLEGIAVVVYDPDSGMIDEVLPNVGSGLRWEEFVEDIATSYSARFEE